MTEQPIRYNDIKQVLEELGYKIHRYPVERTQPGELVMVLKTIDLNFQCADGQNANYIPQTYVDIGWNTDDPDTIIDELIKIVSGLHQRFNSASFMVRDPDIDILGTAYRISIPVDWKQSFDTNDNTVG